MDIKDMKQGSRYRVTFEGRCQGESGTAVQITPDGTEDSIGTHYLRSEFTYVIEEIGLAEPDYNNVVKMTATYPQQWFFHWSDTFEKWTASNSVKYTWEGLLDVAKRNGHTIKVYSLTEVK